MSKLILILGLFVFLSSCETNVVHKYECEGKEDLISQTLVRCISAANGKENGKNSIYECKEVVKELLCKPVYKTIEGPSFELKDKYKKILDDL